MKWRDLLGEWGVSKLQLKLGFVEAEFAPQDVDRQAAWELYVELATRVSTQRLLDAEGSEKQALSSVYSLFPTTREILKKHGPSAQNFARVAIAVLNVVLRPFLTRWHLEFERGTALDEATAKRFRDELAAVRGDLFEYTKVLAAIADVEQLA
jgi:hypothetical protein